MLDVLKQSINDLHKVDRPSLEDECDALLIRIEQARTEGTVTGEQATQLFYDVRNERSRCFRSGSQRRMGNPGADLPSRDSIGMSPMIN
jgi:hypothetical protein